MKENITRYSESYSIRASEVDTKGKATLSAICSLFQEIAGNHALTLNFDITNLKDQSLTWVLHRMDIKILRYPEWRETITIETWPAAGDALRAYRDYRILDEDKNEIGYCLSYWMMINLDTRRPVRMPKEVLELRLEEIDHVVPVKNDQLKPFDEVDEEKKLFVRSTDLDMNNHVNNARYVEWMMEVLKPGERDQIREMDIMFLRESSYEDVLRSQLKRTEDSSSFHQLKNQDNEVIAVARIK